VKQTKEAKVFWFFSSEKNKNHNCPATWRSKRKLLTTKARRHEGFHKDVCFVKPSCLRAFVVNSFSFGIVSTWADKKTLLFLKKKKQKDFYSSGCVAIRGREASCALH
jgi:hypothetical protein